MPEKSRECQFEPPPPVKASRVKKLSVSGSVTTDATTILLEQKKILKKIIQSIGSSRGLELRRSQYIFFPKYQLAIANR